MVPDLKNKIFTLDEVLEKINDGASILFTDLHGGMAPDEIIEGMIKKGVKNLTAVGVASGRPDCGMGKLITNHQVSKLLTTHIGLNKSSIDQMFAGEMEVEFIPQGTFAERIRCGGFGLGGALTRTGFGTSYADGKDIVTVDGVDYILEKPIHCDLAILKVTKADKAGNCYCRGSSHLCVDYMAMAADFVIVEAEEVVEIGELDPEKVIVQAPIVDMIYERTGEKRPMWPFWQKQIDKIKAKQAAK